MAVAEFTSLEQKCNPGNALGLCGVVVVDMPVSTDGTAVLKDRVKAHWEDEPCGTRFGESDDRLEFFDGISRQRYAVEPYIAGFAEFEKATGKKVLEIGVGAGSDFENWVRNGAIATGVDLTAAAIALTKERLLLKGYGEDLFTLGTADAENLGFDDQSFDLVYAYGVIHHSPDTEQCLREIFRVLNKGGTAKIMVYSTFSMTGLMLWVRHGLLVGRPFRSQRDIIYDHLESPGTKSFSPEEFKGILEKHGFENVSIRKQLCVGDLLDMPQSRKYQGSLYGLIWKLYPRWLIRLFGNRFGLFLLCEARKPG